LLGLRGYPARHADVTVSEVGAETFPAASYAVTAMV
jgi:hypothetical protein